MSPACLALVRHVPRHECNHLPSAGVVAVQLGAFIVAGRTVEPDEAAKEKRDLARRARRLADNLSKETDKVRLHQYADELEREAADIERSAGNLPTQTSVAPLVTQQQQQQQQQHETETRADPKEPK